MNDSLVLSDTLEDYLEAIWQVTADKGAARVRDIAVALSVHKSSVTSALKSLARRKLVNYAPYNLATLTPQGRRVAQEVVNRHEIIRRFLVDVLSVQYDIADTNACRMEHVLDKDILRRLSLFMEFVKECPRAGVDWLEKFRDYLAQGGRLQVDKTNLARWLKDLKEKLPPENKTGEAGKELKGN